MTHPPRAGLRTIALFEAAKGLLVLVAGSGLLLLAHADAQALAAQLVSHLHLDPAKRYPRIFLQLATEASPGRLHLLAAGALAYAAIRFAEGWGLWKARRWAEWLGAVSGAIYVPFELAAMLRHPGLEPLIALTVNVVVVAYLTASLRGSLWRSSGGTP